MRSTQIIPTQNILIVYSYPLVLKIVLFENAGIASTSQSWYSVPGLEYM